MEFLLYLFEALFRQNEQCIEQNGSEDWIALWSEHENIFLRCTKQPGFLLFEPTACDPCSSCITAVKNVKKCATRRQECVLKTDIFFSQYSNVYFRLHHKYNVVYNGPVRNCIILQEWNICSRLSVTFCLQWLQTALCSQLGMFSQYSPTLCTLWSAF